MAVMLTNYFDGEFLLRMRWYLKNEYDFLDVLYFI